MLRLLATLALAGVALAVPSQASPETATITSGAIWADTSGKPVHAHGAGIVPPDSHPAGKGGVYYMVGASQKTQPGWLSEGINVYSSTDLQHWKFEAEIFHNSSITTPLPEGEIPYYRIERPKVIYNKSTKKYVMYFHLDSNGFKMGMVGVCTCDTIAGKYKFVSGFQPDGQRSLDMGLFQDTDGTAYLIRSVNNAYAGFSKLSADYLKPMGIISKGPKCEGQAVWREGDTYYLLGSHLTGWSANAAILSMHKGPIVNGSKWTVLGNPSGDKTTFNSQSTYVLPYTHPSSGKKLIIYMGDRWNDGGRGSVGNASYVWLPLQKSTSDPSGFTMPPLSGGGDGSWKVSQYLRRPIVPQAELEREEKPRAVDLQPQALDPHAAPLIGGTGDWKYQYMPLKLQMPVNSSPPYSHGLERDDEDNLYLTYFDSADPDRCLLRWSPSDGYTNYTVLGHGSELCKSGDSSNGPHGLRIAREASGTYFYHANNNQALFKTDLLGNVLWSVYGPTKNGTKLAAGEEPPLNSRTGKPHTCVHGSYCPTWFGAQPNSNYIYMADGYGNDQIHVYTTDGKYTGHTVGGKGDNTTHGKFNIPHSISWDPRRSQMVVSDRANHRFEYFNISKTDPSVFDYVSTSTMDIFSNDTGLVCNARFLSVREPGTEFLVAPTLEGWVFILDAANKMVANINVNALLGDKGFNHPHDAIFLTNGDFVVATWNPGRTGYFKKIDCSLPANAKICQ